MPKIKSSLKTIMEKARRIEVLVMDVDGVLTPGHIVLDTKGKELKFFDVKDGFGLMFLKKAGLKSAIITAGNTSAVAERARQLKIDLLFQGAIDKLSA